MWWPPTPMSNISSKEHSKPKSTWLKYSCIVKRLFANYELAVRELNKMEAQTDTEDEEVVGSLKNAQQELPPPAIHHNYEVTRNRLQQYDFNNLLVLPPSNPNNIPHQANNRINAKPNPNTQYTTDLNNLLMLADKALPVSESNGDTLIVSEYTTNFISSYLLIRHVTSLLFGKIFVRSSGTNK